jgi:hypothetical protein
MSSTQFRDGIIIFRLGTIAARGYQIQIAPKLCRSSIESTFTIQLNTPIKVGLRELILLAFLSQQGGKPKQHHDKKCQSHNSKINGNTKAIFAPYSLKITLPVQLYSKKKGNPMGSLFVSIKNID